MPIRPNSRKGQAITIKRRPVEFSRWPVNRTTRRYALQPIIFANSPWNIIRNKLTDTSTNNPDEKREALAFVDQAEDYFTAARHTLTIATKPVLFYYSFLNLAKAFIIHRKILSTLPSAKHGLSEERLKNGQELINTNIKAYGGNRHNNIFDAFYKALTGNNFTTSERVIKIIDVLPQILQGHRIWCGITDKPERFISIADFGLMDDPEKKSLWSTLYFDETDLSRLDLTSRQLRLRSGLDELFRVVLHNNSNMQNSLALELKNVVRYTGRSADKVQQVVDSIRPHLWTNILSVPPYRNYYIYLCPDAEKNQKLPQILSIYAIFYYLGSLTRYRPHKFNEILTGKYSIHIKEILLNIPPQFVYLIACEFAEQEVVPAAII